MLDSQAKWTESTIAGSWKKTQTRPKGLGKGTNITSVDETNVFQLLSLMIQDERRSKL